MVLQIIAIIVIGLSLIVEIATTLTYGWFLTDARYLEYIVKRMETIRVNTCDAEILTECGLSAKPMIYIHAPSLFSKWCINGIGRIPRWSKMHKIIDNKRMELLING